MGTVTAIVADNLVISHAGWLYFLKMRPEIGQIIDATDKKELATLLPANPTSIVIIDYTHFDFTGVEDLINMTYRYPSTHWILFSDELSQDFVKRVVNQTLNTSILYRDSSREEILSAMTASLRRERFLSASVSAQLVEIPSTESGISEMLTHSEREILRLIALGKSTKEIASERFSSIHTITTHRKNIFRKLEVNSVYEATRYALRAGIIDAAEYYI
jgi:two-component system, NarL family, response regulator LiaR